MGGVTCHGPGATSTQGCPLSTPGTGDCTGHIPGEQVVLPRQILLPTGRFGEVFRLPEVFGLCHPPSPVPQPPAVLVMGSASAPLSCLPIPTAWSAPKATVPILEGISSLQRGFGSEHGTGCACPASPCPSPHQLHLSMGRRMEEEEG